MPPTLGHIILIPSEPVFAYSPYRYVLGGEASYTNCMTIGLNRRGEQAHHYTTDVVLTPLTMKVTRKSDGNNPFEI